MKKNLILSGMFLLINISCLGGSRVLSNFDTLQFENIGANEGFIFKDSLEGQISFSMQRDTWEINHEEIRQFARKVYLTNKVKEEQIVYTCIKTAIEWTEKKQIDEFKKMEKMNIEKYKSEYKLLGFNYINSIKPNYAYQLIKGNMCCYNFEYYSNQCYIVISYKSAYSENSKDNFEKFLMSIQAVI